MKKLLLVHHAGGMGGAPMSLSLILREIANSDYDSTLLLTKDGPVKELFDNTGIPVILNTSLKSMHGATVSKKWSRKIFLNNLIWAPLSFSNAKKVIAQLKPDIIHLNSSALAIVALAAKSVNKNIKVICHVREPLRNSFFGKIIRRLCYRAVDYFIAIDNYAASTMKTRNNLTVIPNPVDLKRFSSKYKSTKIREELKISPNKIVFLFLARIAEGNGVFQLLEIARKQLGKNDFHFIISGFNAESKDLYSLEARAEATSLSNVSLLAYRNDVIDVIAAADVMIVPFTEPHFARAGIEAAAMGKPCIGANIGGVKDCIQHGTTGFLYSNMKEFEHYCTLLGNDEVLRKRLGENAVLFAKNNFDAHISAIRVLEVYKKVLHDQEVSQINL